MVKIGKNEKSLAGEFFTVAELFYHGFIATPTLGKTKHVDIFVYDPKTEKRKLVEVKTTSERIAKVKLKLFGENYEWIMDKKHEEIVDENLFYCFVLLRGLEKLPRFYIVPSKDVASYLKWEHQRWLDKKKKEVEGKKQVEYKKKGKVKVLPVDEYLRLIDTPIRTFRIDVNDKKYENNWDLLRR